VVFVNARVAAIGAVAAPAAAGKAVTSSAPCTARSRRKAFFGQWIDVPVYALDDLNPGQGLEGPAIVEAETTTVVINTGDRLTVNVLGWLDIHVGKAGKAIS